MVVLEELKIATAEDIPVYAAGHRVQRTAREVALAAQGRGSEAADNVWTCATTLTALIAMALRAPDAESELLRWRQAELIIDLLRADAYQMLRERSLAPAMFDEIVRVANGCRNEVQSCLRQAKGRAWAQLHGAAPSSRPLLTATTVEAPADDDITAPRIVARGRRRTLTLP